MRPIDADALKEFIDNCGICAICPQRAPRCSYDCDFPEFVTEKWNVAIDAQPTIDAVSVVRCKECKRTKDYFKQHTDRLVWCEKWKWAMNTNGYCSYGERKDHERLDRER